jgi:hypothetical protein
MHVAPPQQLANGPRFARDGARAAHRYGLAGDARPGDVLALAGGELVRDRNANGLIDGADARLDVAGVHVDVIAGVDAGGARRGALVDVRG